MLFIQTTKRQAAPSMDLVFRFPSDFPHDDDEAPCLCPPSDPPPLLHLLRPAPRQDDLLQFAARWATK